MSNKPMKCMTPGCQNMSYHLHCLSCSAEEAKRKTAQAAAGICVHGHSITGDYDMIKRLIPSYAGSHPEPGYMLDVCKTCSQELQQRPYNPARPGRGY